jgi:Phage Tail Collar Domain
MRALPGVAPSQNKNGISSGLRLVPESAEPIPDNVLAKPIIGEARRFDGTTPPAGWVWAKGQSLGSAQYPQLSSILKHVAEPLSSSSGTFTLPNPGFGLIVAAAGTFPTSPQLLKGLGRKMQPEDSLGPNAQRVVGRRLSPRFLSKERDRATAVLASQRLISSAPRARSGPSIPIAPELAAAIEQSRASARLAALGRLSPANSSRAESVAAAIASGRTSTHEGQLQMAAVLSQGEAASLLQILDAHTAAFRPGWPGMNHPDAVADAAHFIVDITMTPEQQRAYAELPGNR